MSDLSMQYQKVPLSTATKVPEKTGFYCLIREHWWAVTEDDCILLFDGHSPQCNRDKRIVDRLLKHKNQLAVEVKYIPEVFLPHDCQDYV